MHIQKYSVPERLTARHIPRIEPETIRKASEPNRPIYVQVKYEMPDELKLIVFGGFVAMMAWLMLSAYIALFSKPEVIIVQPDGSISRID